MAQLVSGSMRLLLRAEVLELGRLSFSDEDSFFTETLLFRLENDIFIEILKINQSDLDIHLIDSGEKLILPSWIEDEEEDTEDVS
jgi:hypothetical protein